jgi:hypothetical protein
MLIPYYNIDFVNFLTYYDSYNVKLMFYSVKLVSIVLILAVGFGGQTITHTQLELASPSVTPTHPTRLKGNSQSLKLFKGMQN